MKKGPGIFLILLLTASLAVAGYFILGEKSYVAADPWSAVPADAFLILETDDFPELLTSVNDRNGLMSHLSGMSWAKRLMRDAYIVDSITGEREIRELISNRKAVISLHVTRQGRAAALVVLTTDPGLNSRHIVALCKKAGATVSDMKELGGAKSFTLNFGSGSNKGQVFAAAANGLIIISSSSALVENGLNNRSTGSDIRNQQGFTSVAGAAGKNSDNLFLLFRNLPRFLQPFADPDQITAISSVAVAAGGDLTNREEGIYLSGFISTAGAGTGADRLRGSEPAECGVHELLPATTLSYTTRMKRASLGGETSNDISSMTATDIALALSPFTGTEVTTSVISTSGGNEVAVIFRMTDRQAAEAMLKERLGARYKSQGFSDKYYITTLQGGREEGVIYKLPFPGVAAILAGDQSLAGKDSWVFFSRSYMVFSASQSLLSVIKGASDNENTLINDPQFREMEKTLPTKSAFVFYSTGRELHDLAGKFITPEAMADITEEDLGSLNSVSLSLTPSGDMLYASFSVRYNDGEPLPARRENVTHSQSSDTAINRGLNLLWKVKLDAALASKPFLFINHNTGAAELFIQDQNNNIYLLSASGKILWKATIRERIQGDIYMMDYYKNGKNQILFAGKNYLHLIDRNGNYVDKFPIKLRSPATNSLALFDYESNKDYRLAIAGDDNRIYVYDRAGMPVKGWNLFAAGGKVTDPVTFFRVRGKDYLFVSDDRSVYLLDRTGNIRVSPGEPLRKAAGSAVRLTQGSTQVIVFSTPDGTVIHLSLDGRVTRKSFGSFSPGHQSDFFDVDGDGITDYIFVDKGALKAFDYDGTLIFEKQYADGEITGPLSFQFSSSDLKTGVIDNGKKLFYLLGSSGETIAGFPVRSGQEVTIGKLSGRSTWNLLLNENDNYLYNYEFVNNK